jgi:putative photosynthetic complex assembly protein 2
MDQFDIVIPVIFVLLVWWLSTGVILYLDQLPPSTFFISLSAATALAIGALIMLAFASHELTVVNVYIGFSAAILIWGWQEMAFLMGFITGPRRIGCPPGATESQKFVFASKAVLYHELALIVTLLVLYLASWKQPNMVGAHTFFILWIMRLSAKLNLFFGVRNRYESFLPPHLTYLESYFGRRSINLLFPFVVAAASVAAYLLWQSAIDQEATPALKLSYTLMATLLTLAVLEHWFLVIPLSVEKMWGWAMGKRSR